jgi:tripartite-type tricarboxylate transporter receptor subunit TctC
MQKRRLWLAAGILALAASGAALAQEFPGKPIRLINGFAPGGPLELISRVIAGPLSERLGQPVVVESRPGASGIIAAEAIAKAEPDGHTLGMFTGAHTTFPALGKKLPYDTVDSFQPVTSIVYYAFVVAVRADHEAKTMRQLIDLAKASPGKLNYGSAGNGTSSHLAGELLKLSAGIDLVHVPYKGDAGSMTALLGGEIQVSIATTVGIAPRIQAGTLRALAITSPARWRGLPEVPTLAESGLQGFDARTWAGIMGPKGMPRPVADRLNAEIQRIIALPEIKSRLEAIVGGEVRGSTPEEMRAMLTDQVARWTKAVRDANIKAD